MWLQGRELASMCEALGLILGTVKKKKNPKQQIVCTFYHSEEANKKEINSGFHGTKVFTESEPKKHSNIMCLCLHVLCVGCVLPGSGCASERT